MDHPRVRDEFVKSTAEKLREHHGICCGFVVMPNHVHAIAGLVARVVDWSWSSAGVYVSGMDADVPLEWIFET